MSAREKESMMPEVSAQSGEGATAEEMATRSPEEVASYIADMLLGLRNMAKDKQLEFLAYLLEMSFQEAFELSQKKRHDG